MKFHPSIFRPSQTARIEPLEARIAPAFGAVVNLATLNLATGVQLDSTASGDGTGYSVADAGDVNSDGFRDVIIGVPFADDNGTDSGAAYVIFGKSGGIDPALLLPPASVTEGFKIKGASAGDQFGISVSGNGDLNNDGFDDVVVGAPAAGGSGAVYVVFGSAAPSLVVEASTLNGANGFKLAGAGAGQEFGESVSFVGDVHGDGFDDIAIGASGDDDYGTNAGAAYVVYGAATFAGTINVASLSSGSSKLLGETSFDFMGASVAAAGDVNKDGKDDFIVGAPGTDLNGVDSGSAYVVFGSASLPNFFTAAGVGGAAGFEIRGVAANNLAGSSVGGAGDINGDSFADVIVGSPNPVGSGLAGSAAVIFGSNTISAPVEISALNGTTGFKFSGLSTNDRFGLSLAGTGDVNGDGIGDLIAGAHKAGTAAGAEAGAAYVIYGQGTAFNATFDLATLDGSNGFRIDGAFAGGFAGLSVSRAGDVDGDGIDDFLVGAPATTGSGSGLGAAFLIYGQPMTDIDVSIVAGAAVIGNTPGAESTANLQIVRTGGFIDVSDPIAILRAQGGAIQVNPNRVLIPFSSITSTLAFDGGSGDDVLTLNFVNGPLSPGLVGFVGGDGVDAILIDGPTDSSAAFGFTSASGALISSGATIAYDDVESITDFRAIDSRIVTATDDTGYAITVSDHGGGFTNINVSPGLLYRFATPATLLSISGDDGADSITVASYAAQPQSALSFSGGIGSDSLSILAPLQINRLDIDMEAVGPFASISIGLGGGIWQNSTGAFSFAGGSELGMKITGDESFLSSTLFVVRGALDLAGASLRINGTVSGLVSQPLLLIDNDGTDPIAGVFNGLPEGAGVMLGIVPYVITYVGGDGNDVMLTRRISFGSSLLGNLDGSDGFTIGSAGGDERIGTAVSMIGDVNGDGFDDFAITAPRAPLSFGSDFDGGLTYVILGKDTPFDSFLPVTSLDGTNGFVIRGVDGGDFSGSSVSGGGDINGDGFADIVIGATGADPVSGNPGAVYVIFGRSAGFSKDFELSSLDGSIGFRLDGESDGDHFGASVNAFGDINGDGITDIVVGAPDAVGTPGGRAYVLFGSRQPFPAAISGASLNGNNGFFINGTGELTARFGAAVGTVDINGDGFDDVVVGAPSSTVPGDVYGALKGAAYVVFGAPIQRGDATSVATLNGKNGFKILGELPFSSAGFAVGGAGDFNDDGIDDLIIGAPGSPFLSTLAQPGSAFVILGKAAGWLPKLDVATLNGTNGFEIVGAANEDLAGTSVGSVGDFNGDGVSDIIIGAPGSDASGLNKGAAHVIFGRPGPLPPRISLASINGTNGYSFLGSEQGERVGSSIAGIGDINRDGLADIAAGAPFYGDDGAIDGRGYAVFGKPGISPLPRILGGGASAVFLDVDGDEIVVKVTGGKVNADMFTFSPEGELLFVDLNAGGTLKRGANLTFLVNPRGGDGLLNVGAISGVGMNLGKISVTGDLGQIDITPLNPLKPVLKQLIVGSLGMMGAANQIPGTIDPLVSEIGGSVTKVVVKRNIEFASLFIEGALGNITINGDFNGLGALSPAQLASLGLLTSNVAGGGTLANSGLSAGSIGQLNIKQSLNNAAVQSGGNIGSASVGGSVNRGAIVAGGKIGVVKVVNSITSDDLSSPSVIAARGRLNPGNAAAAVAINTFIVRGDVTNSEILIGYDSSFNAVNPDAGLGKLTVRGDWTASSLTAGIEDGGDDGFGQNDTAIPETEVDTILSRIASVVILGTVAGTSSADDSFAITAERISKVKIGSTVLPLDKLVFDDILVDGTTNFRIKEIARL